MKRRIQTLIRRSRGAAWVTLVNRVGASDLLTPDGRRRAYLLAGIDIDASARIGGKAAFDPGSDVHIAAGSYVNRSARFFGHARIDIGSSCVISHEVLFETTDHAPGDHHRRAGENVYRPIVVQDGCFIGARVTVLGGVTIGAGCVIGAGAVVNRDCEPDGLYVGVPARRIRELPTETLSSPTRSADAVSP